MKPAGIELPRDREPERRQPRLEPLEAEVITLFVQIGKVLGKPRCVAEIYGLVFIADRPLAMDDLIERLGQSKGSVSMGLRQLRNFGAVKMVYVPGSRRVHYEAVAELRTLARRFLQDQIVPHLEGSVSRIETIAALVRQLPPEKRARAVARLALLRSWEKQGRKFLPLALKLLGG